MLWPGDVCSVAVLRQAAVKMRLSILPSFGQDTSDLVTCYSRPFLSFDSCVLPQASLLFINFIFENFD